jgi:hypothetical protein
MDGRGGGWRGAGNDGEDENDAKPERVVKPFRCIPRRVSVCGKAVSVCTEKGFGAW